MIVDDGDGVVVVVGDVVDCVVGDLIGDDGAEEVGDSTKGLIAHHHASLLHHPALVWGFVIIIVI